MTLGPQQQAAADDEHLRLLSILYFIYGGLTGAFSLVALCFVLAGLAMGAGGAFWWGPAEPQAGAAIAGCFMAALGSAFFVFLGAAAACRILVGLALRRRRYYVLCLVAAGLTCLELPLGAAIGAATLIVLLRPSVERLFSGLPPLPPAGSAAAPASPPSALPPPAAPEPPSIAPS